MPREDLDALVARAQEGDVRAFEALVAAYLPHVRRFARAFASEGADADDLAQEALLRVYRSLRSFRYQSAFSSWLYSVVRNVFLDSGKGRSGTRRALEEPLQAGHLEQGGGDRPDDALERAQERELALTAGVEARDGRSDRLVLLAPPGGSAAVVERERRHDLRWFGGEALSLSPSPRLAIVARHDLLLARTNLASSSAAAGRCGPFDAACSSFAADARSYDKHVVTIGTSIAW